MLYLSRQVHRPGRRAVTITTPEGRVIHIEPVEYRRGQVKLVITAEGCVVEREERPRAAQPTGVPPASEGE